MSRLKLFIVLGFGTMFVAGLEVGRSHTSISSLKGDWSRAVSFVTGKPAPAPATQPTKPEPEHTLFGEIQLTAAQDEQIHKIYHEAHTRTDGLGRQFRDLDHQRDEEIVAILDPLQKIEYDEIQQDRDARVAELRSQIGAEMEKAGKDVRALLNSDQQKKYDEVVKKKADEMKDRGRRGQGNGPWRGPGTGHRNHPGGPDTMPTTEGAPIVN